jgi:hypothetical protein
VLGEGGDGGDGGGSGVRVGGFRHFADVP